MQMKVDSNRTSCEANGTASLEAPHSTMKLHMQTIRVDAKRAEMNNETELISRYDFSDVLKLRHLTAQRSSPIPFVS